MSRVLLICLLSIGVFADITIEKAKLKPIGQILKTSAQVVELPNQTQNVVTQIGGHIEKYFVKEGDSLKKGDKIALVRSLELGTLTSNYFALKAKTASLQKRLKAAKKLYRQGLVTLDEFEKLKVALSNAKQQLQSLKLKLQTLGITHLAKPTEEFVVTAHTSGKIDKILVPVHSNVDANRVLAVIVAQKELYVIAYLPVDVALHLIKPKATFSLANFSYRTEFIRLLPKVDSETMQARVLFRLVKDHPILIGAFGDMVVQTAPYKKRVVIKKSALTMLEGDWVVFVPSKEHEEHKHHHRLHFEPRVVEVEEFLGNYAVVTGLAKGEEYISKDVYLLKSKLLKESIGEHGH